MGKAKNRIAATATQLDKLYEDGDLGLSPYGALLISLGVREHLAAHPCEEHRDDERSWRDSTGKPWQLVEGDEGWVFVEYEDPQGCVWSWSGGFRWDPDKQPMMSSMDRSEEDVPLSRLLAVVGSLQARKAVRPAV